MREGVRKKRMEEKEGESEVGKETKKWSGREREQGRKNGAPLLLT